MLHAALVACSLYLLMAFISHDWLDIAPVLLAHPKVLATFSTCVVLHFKSVWTCLLNVVKSPALGWL